MNTQGFAVIVKIDVMNPFEIGRVAHNNHVELLVVDGIAYSELTPEQASNVARSNAQYIFTVPATIVSSMTSARKLVELIIKESREDEQEDEQEDDWDEE
jgi:hypothetical protein